MIRRESRFCVLLDGSVAYDGRVQRTVRTLSGLGHVLLVTSGGSEADQNLFGERVQVIPTVRPTLAGVRKWFLLHRHNDQLADAALTGGRSFDLVWANDYSTLFPALQIASATGAKVVYDSHEIWLETINQFFPTDVALPKRMAFRAIITACRAIGRRAERTLASQVDSIITVNESVAAVLRHRLGQPEVEVVLNCPQWTDISTSDRIRHELGLGATNQIVLYQGLMNPGRGLRELVESARHFPEGVRLVMLGDGMLEPSLRSSAQEAGLADRVFFPGFVPQAELHQWTMSADLGVLILDPINLSKRLALANKVFEYMAAGIPILATDLPENRRIIEGCDCGWLIPSRTPKVLAENIARVLAQSDEMRRRGDNGRRWFEERYNWEVESARVVSIVENLMARTGVASG